MKLKVIETTETIWVDHIKVIIKASIAQQLFGSNTFELILNNDDKMIQKVLELESKLEGELIID